MSAFDHSGLSLAACSSFITEPLFNAHRQEMIEIYGGGAAAKSEEFVDGLNSVESYTLAQAWERIRDEIRVLQEADRKSGVQP